MASPQEQYSELCALMRLYLIQEHSLSDRLPVSYDHYIYFRDLAIRSKKSAPLDQKQTKVPTQTEEPIASPSHSPKSATISTSPPTVKPPVSKEAKRLPFAESVKLDEPVRNQPKEVNIPLSNKIVNIQDSYEEVLKIIQEAFPNLTLVPPPFYEAKEDADAEVLFVLLGESTQEKRFIQNIAKALSICFQLPCKVVNTLPKNLEKVKLVAVSQSKLSSHPCELPIHVKLVPLPDLTLHMQNPHLKASLWSTLSNEINHN